MTQAPFSSEFPVVPRLTGRHFGRNGDPCSTVSSWRFHPSQEGFVMTPSDMTLLMRKWSCKDLPDNCSTQWQLLRSSKRARCGEVLPTVPSRMHLMLCCREQTASSSQLLQVLLQRQRAPLSAGTSFPRPSLLGVGAEQRNRTHPFRLSCETL